MPKDEKGKESKDAKGSEKKDVDGDEEDADVAATKLPMKTLWGDAGHVVLDYSKAREVTEEGDGDGEEEKNERGGGLSGSILVSMTQWCELVKLGSSVRDDVLFKVAAKNLGTGSAAYQTMQAQYESLGQDVQQQKAWVMQ